MEFVRNLGQPPPLVHVKKLNFPEENNNFSHYVSIITTQNDIIFYFISGSISSNFVILIEINRKDFLSTFTFILLYINTTSFYSFIYGFLILYVS